MVAMSTVDVAMLGRVSEQALTAIALAHNYTFVWIIFAFGTLHALDPLISQALGATQKARAAADAERTRGELAGHVQRGLVLAAVLSIPAVLACVPAEAVLLAMRQPPDVIPLAVECIDASVLGIPPFLAFIVLRQTMQAMSRVRAVVVTVLAANVLNAVLDWALIWGNWGAPSLGAVGCAWATTACRTAMALGLLLGGGPALHRLVWPLRRDALALRPLRGVVRIGAPVGMAHLLEYGAFFTTALLMGSLGRTELAAHHIAINMAALTFMVPQGLAAGAAVRVGYAVGAEDAPRARRAASVSLGSTVVVMSVFAIVMLSAAPLLARLYTDEASVLALTASLVQIAGVFQVFDGVQVVAAGVLRGIDDTRSPVIVQAIGFWVVGLPIGWGLATGLGLGPIGLWWGLVIGLMLAAVFLTRRVTQRFSRPLAGVRLGPEPSGQTRESRRTGTESSGCTGSVQTGRSAQE